MKRLVGKTRWVPISLAKAGVLKGKRAIASTEKNNIREHGGEVVFDPVVVDGNIITAIGPSASDEFGKAVLKKLGI